MITGAGAREEGVSHEESLGGVGNGLRDMAAFAKLIGLDAEG